MTAIAVSITRSLNLPGTVQAYSLEKYNHSFVMVLEDFGAISLQQIIHNSDSVRESTASPRQFICGERLTLISVFKKTDIGKKNYRNYRSNS
ncbi:MAG: hypothetical protein WAN66_08025 [Limnoraphis robusta]|uniref:hypothetical protein n=1 Tax=Limnoraphis robusta TaxID=1118279 RepID=UPI00061B110E|nr:hypothetical protein [Limnoraphis robusta]MEA5539663.1 hypothetical protein [Limnoraphis robusta Tam1]